MLVYISFTEVNYSLLANNFKDRRKLVIRFSMKGDMNSQFRELNFGYSIMSGVTSTREKALIVLGRTYRDAWFKNTLIQRLYSQIDLHSPS